MTGSLENRISRLEFSNRRLRRSFVALLLTLAAVLLMGNLPNQSPPVLEAQRFVLKDASGHERGSLFATDTSWGLVLYNPDSSKGAAFIVSNLGSAAMLMNAKGSPGVAAMASDDMNTLSITNLKTGHTAAELKNTAEGSALRFLDANQIDRVDVALPPSGGAAVLFNDPMSKTRTMVSENYPGISTWDQQGSFVWAAGFDGLSKDDQEKIRTLMQKFPIAGPQK